AAGENGTINGTSETLTFGGKPQHVPTVTPDSGYAFAGWSSDGGTTKLSPAQVAATNVKSNITYTAYYISTIPGAPILQSAAAGNAHVTLAWSAVDGATGYTLYQSTTTGENGSEAATVSGSVYSYDVAGLTNGTTYYFVVTAVIDGSAGPASNQVSATPMTVPAAPTNVTAIAGNGQAIVSFSSPSDDGGSAVTGYEVTATPGNITVKGTISPLTVTGLTNGTTYMFAVKAYNQVGDGAASKASNAVTPSEPADDEGSGDSGDSGTSPDSPSPSGSGSSSGSNSPNTPDTPDTPSTPATGVDVLVNGKAENAGTAETSKVDDQTVTTITVDPQKLEQRLASENQGAVITIPVNTGADVTIGQLNGQMIKNMEQQQATVEIRTDNASYTLPAQQINISALSSQLGANIELQDIKVQIEISKPSDDQVKVVENAAVQGEFTVVVPSLDFTVTSTYGDTTIEVTQFNAYVERSIAIPDEVDPNKITTGVVVDQNGSVRHVPTKVVADNGKYYARINSLTNSTYSVVWHPIEFKDVANHWAKAAVNDMGSRMVINGVGNDLFNPDQDITRAEFAAIMVRGLGLRLENGISKFSDVKATEWYGSAIQTARSYSLIDGFEDGTFRPLDRITREQAMVMIARAMKWTGLQSNMYAEEAEELLSPYVDAGDVSEWARQSIIASLAAGIVSGRDGHELAPQLNITRAEVAAIIQKLLQNSGLI
ncbi:MAG: hypothetical protein K0R75_702, partial [Paenibacillaceae bacterium]|nr:hypothetical protein [Paenibacillaceae bacterium]